jgi:hypothetical protein
MKRSKCASIIDFQKEQDIKEISRILRTRADAEYVNALSRVLADKFKSDSQHDTLDPQPA